MPRDTSLINTVPISVPLLPPYTPRGYGSNPETASIRSSAPSYVSAAPTYHSTLPSTPCSSSSRRVAKPSLSVFRRPTGSLASVHMRGNPQARHYHNIAHRRAEERGERDRIEFLAAGGRRDPVKAVKMVVGIREREEFGCEIGGVGGRRVRPLEDPELVGESAADMARRERLRREGMEVLEREDMRWDWFLSQMADWPQRERDWKVFAANAEKTKRERLAAILGLGQHV